MAAQGSGDERRRGGREAGYILEGWGRVGGQEQYVFRRGGDKN